MAGMTMSASTTNSEPGDGPGLSPPAVVEPLQLHPHALDARDASVAEELDGSDEREDLDPLLARLLDLARVGGHVLDLAAVEDGHLLRAEAQDRAGRVERGGAAADDDDVHPDLDLPAEVRLAQERDAVEDPGLVLAGDLGLVRELGAGRHVDRLVALLQLLELHVLADLDAGLDLHADLLDEAGLLREDLLREAVLGDAGGEHAAGDGERLVDGDAVAEAREVVGAGEARGAGADDADRLGLLREDEVAVRLVVREDVVGGVALQVADGDRLVELGPAALAPRRGACRRGRRSRGRGSRGGRGSRRRAGGPRR